jgi:hypothetical protein
MTWLSLCTPSQIVNMGVWLQREQMKLGHLEIHRGTVPSLRYESEKAAADLHCGLDPTFRLIQKKER